METQTIGLDTSVAWLCQRLSDYDLGLMILSADPSADLLSVPRLGLLSMVCWLVEEGRGTVRRMLAERDAVPRAVRVRAGLVSPQGGL